MAPSSGFAIAITATDRASGTLDGINKRLATLSAPADRFNRALSKFGDVSGINRVSEGFGSLTRTAHDAFMSIDRVSGPLAAITGAASIAGIVALTQRWADLGSTIGRTGFRLSLPVEKLSAIQGAGRRFGATAEQVTQSLSGLRETLYDAAWGRNPAAIQALHALNIDPGTPGHITDTMKAMDQLADRVAGESDVHTKLRIMGSVGIDPSMLPLMNKGSKGIHEEMQRQADLGGTVTQQMTDSAIRTKQSFDDLGTAIGGVASRLGDDLGKRVRGYAESAAIWIGANQDTADSIAGISTAISLLVALKPASWVLRLLGLGATADAVGAAGTAGAAAAGLLAVGAWNGANNLPMVDEFGRPIGTWGGQDIPASPGGAGAGNPIWNRLSRWWSGSRPSEAPSGAPGANPRDPRGIRNNNPLNLSYLPGQGAIGSDGRFGVYATMEDGIAAEARQLARYTETGADTLRKVITRWAPPTENDTEGYIRSVSKSLGIDPNQQIDLHDPLLSSRLIHSMSRVENGRAVQMDTIQNGVGQATQNGHVQVDVHLHGAPPGTSARVTTSGPVTAPPPRIETPMPMN